MKWSKIIVYRLCKVFLFYALSIVPVVAQQFQREVDTIPVIINGAPVHSPFAGGIELAKPTLADIDDDGKLDLFVGAKNGNINFYRNTGNATNPAFTLETENFAAIDIGNNSAPAFADIDDDGDLDLIVGEEDGNINFYRNTGTATNSAFTLETENFAAINIGSGSVPAFADLDQDGDLDLFVGTDAGNINFYRNTGNATNPALTLETANFAAIDVGAKSIPTFADIDNDQDPDLFVGEFNGTINFYRNTGAPTSLAFTLETENFAAIDAGQNNAPMFADIDNDSDLDLFVGQGDGKITYYPGALINSSFTLKTENFAAVDAGQYSAPAFADIDNDGDSDLFVGTANGNIHLYRNTGTATNPSFTLETENFAAFDVGLNSTPTFVDIDNDGDLDLFIGELGGRINVFPNIGTATIPNFNLDTAILAFINVGLNSVPTFTDTDNDGDLDLFVGADVGKLTFVRNTGTATNPAFILETENFAAINVGSKSAPTFIDIDDDGDLDLIVGEENGNLNFYRNTGPAINPAFILATENLAFINAGNKSKPAVVDIDSDGDIDLFLGEADGNVNFYQNTGPATNPDFNLGSQNFVSIDVGLNSFPTFTDIDMDNDLDLFIGKENGRITFYKNTGSGTNPSFTLETTFFDSINVGFGSAPTFIDIDNDSDPDLFIGTELGNINFYRNIGMVTNPSFNFETRNFAAIEVSSASAPIFADIDQDGDFDLFLGALDGRINFYRNIGDAANPDFALETESLAAIDVGSRSTPSFVDIDGDGDLDLFVGELDGNINFYRNTGDATNPDFTLETENFAAIEVGQAGVPPFIDIDNDEDLDLFVGDGSGGLNFYRNSMTTSVSSPETESLPEIFQLSQNYPNPFNPETTIQYHLPKSTQVKLTVYNLLGQRIATLVNAVQPAGDYSVQWDGKDDAGKNVASGIYLYKLESKDFVKVRKLALVQ